MATHEITLPDNLHPDTQQLVAEFAEALGRKLFNAQRKYGYSNKWKDDDWQRDCAEALVEHLQKGDPRDVAAYCAFMWYHDWKTSLHVTFDIGA